MDNSHAATEERDERLDEAVTGYLRALAAGQAPERHEWLARHPDLAEDLAQFLADREEVDRLAAPLRQAVRAAATVSQSAEDTPGPGLCPDAKVHSFGDYELLEKIGQGGMGVVYRARQKNPNRLVAVKLLQGDRPAAETQRFRNEAQTVAELDHPHIVPLYEVGQHENQLYFSMKLIEGGSLADHLPGRGVAFQAAMNARGARFQRAALAKADAGMAGAEVTSLFHEDGRSTTYATITDPRAAARLVADVARAVHHAHQRGILHRDLKPSNILLDDKGRPHVTDFGLAKRVAADSSLTLSGQLVGTPSYMAPEQAVGAKEPLTTAADVYGLGAILYALLTGRPPFRAETVLETLQQVKESEPHRPRSINPKVSRDLETICLKCLRKEPAGRYGSAEALAEDLESFLNGEPIRARPIGRLARAVRWCRRHRPLVTGLAVLVVTLFLSGAAALWWQENQSAAQERQRAATAEAARKDLQEADMCQQREQWPQALQALERAQGRLEGIRLEPLWGQVKERRRQAALVAQLNDARLKAWEIHSDGSRDFTVADKAYANAFAANGLDVAALVAEEIAGQIQSSAIRTHLVTALDQWGFIKERLPKGDSEPLRAIARLADNNKWRQDLRDPHLAKDPKALEHLADDVAVLNQPPVNLLLLSFRLDRAKAIGLVRRAQARYPADFWIHFELALALAQEPATLAEAVGCFRAALALQPRNSVVWSNLGLALEHQKLPEKAVAAFRQAIECKSDNACAYCNLGLSLERQNKLPEAVAAYHKAIELHPDFFLAHNNLGGALHHQGKLPEAEEAHRKAIDLQPKHPGAYYNLGIVLRAQEKLAEAVEAYRKAIELKPDYAQAHINLGTVLRDQGKLPEAEEALRKSIHFHPFVQGYVNLGNVLSDQRKLPEAEEAYHKAIKLEPGSPMGYNSFGNFLLDQGSLPEAEKTYRKAIELKPDSAEAHFGLGAALQRQQKLREAEDAYREAIALKPNYAEVYHNLALALLSQRKLAEAENAYRKAIEHNPRDLEAHNNLGVALEWQGKLRAAEDVYREAIKLNPRNHNAYTNLGAVLGGQQRLPEAEAACRKAIELKPDYAEAHGNLGLALQGQGQFADSLASLKRAQELGIRSPQHAQMIRKAEQFVLLDAKLPKILNGEISPNGATERISVARFCQLPCRQFHAAAARFYSEALAAEPKLANDPGTSVRYDAACAAALAGCGQGKDAANLEAKECARLRAQALAWLRADLTAWQKMEKEPAKQSPRVREVMQRWQSDPDFNGVRGDAALAKLHEAEGREWRKLWEEVEQLARRAGEPK